MSNRIATLSGIALSPGVSKNNRRYTRQAVERAHTRLAARLADPNGRPVVMRVLHPDNRSDLNVTNVAGQVTGVSLENGDLCFTGDIADTAAGRDVAALVTAEKPYLANVSIFGLLVGESTTDRDGIENIDDVEIEALDYVTSPGVESARILAASVAESSPGRKFITESVEETTVTIEAGDGKKPYGNVTYADPGYQKDGKKRYPLDTAKRVRAANAYIGVDSNAAKYTGAQVKRIKSKIATATKKFDIDLTAESAQLASELAEVLEAYASSCLDNNTATVDVRAYVSDPSQLAAIASKLSAASIAALTTLDPDNDGDIDLPDGDAAPECPACGCGCDLGDNFCPVCGAALPAVETDDNAMESASQTTTGDSSMGESSTERNTPMSEETKPEGFAGVTSGVASPHGGTQAVTTDAAPAATTAEAAPAEDTAPTLNEADHAAIAAKVAEALKPPAVTTESSDSTTTTEASSEGVISVTPEVVAEMIQKGITEGVAAAKAELAEETVALFRSGGRKGVVRPVDESGAAKPLHEMSEEERNAYASEAWGSVLGR